jgi:ATP-dependent protease ClpP protease subunit
VKQEIQLAFVRNERKAEIDIYDSVGDPFTGATGRSVLWQLRELEVDQITCRINSLGGVVSEGFDIFNILKEHPAKVTTRISGVAASISSIIALAGDTVEMYANSMYMIHDPYAQFQDGTPPMRETELLRSAELLKTMRSQMYAIYCAKTGLKEEEIASLCANETWMDAKRAKELGFVDRVLEGGENSMLTWKASAKAWEPKVFAFYKNVPQSIRIAAQAAQSDVPTAQTPPKEKKKMGRRRILNRVDMATAKSSGRASVILFALASAVSVMAKKKASDEDGISEDELEALAEQFEEAAARAEETEKELEASKARAVAYEETKKNLDETNARFTKASEELEDVKKKMAELKASGSDDTSVEAAGEDAAMEANLRSTFYAATPRSLRAVARVAMQLTGTQNFEELEGKLLAKTLTIGVHDPEKARAELVDKLISERKLAPARRDWAMKASQPNLDAYLEGIGATPIVQGEIKQGAVAAAQHNNTTVAAKIEGSVAQGEVLANGLTKEEEHVRRKMGYTVEQMLKARGQVLATPGNPLVLS